MHIQPGIVLKAKTNDSLFVSTKTINYPEPTNLYDIDPMEPAFADSWKLLHNRTYQLKGDQFLINLLFRLIILTGGVIREAKFNEENSKYLKIFANESIKFHDSINLNEPISSVEVKRYIDLLHNLIIDCKNPPNRDASIFKPSVIIVLRLKYIDIEEEIIKFNEYVIKLENILFDGINLYKGLDLYNSEGIRNIDTEIKYEPLPDYFAETPEVKRLIPFNAILQKNNKTELYISKEIILSDDELTELNSVKLRGEKFRTCYRLYIKVLSIYGGFMREFNHKISWIFGLVSVDNTKALKVIKNSKVVNTFNVIDPTSISILLLNLLDGIKVVYPSLIRDPSFKRIPEDTMQNFINTLIKIEYDLNDICIHSGIGDVDIRTEIAIEFMKKHYDKKPPYDQNEEKAYDDLTPAKKIFDGANKIELLESIVNELKIIAFDERVITSIYGGSISKIFDSVFLWISFFELKNLFICMIICVIICIIIICVIISFHKNECHFV